MPKQDKTKKRGQRGSELPQEKSQHNKPLYLAIPVLILIVTYACFSPALSTKKQFTNWDDSGYVTDQPLIRDLSAQNVKTLFKPETAVMGNYHPVTMLSFSLNYYFTQIKVKPYMQTNLLIHLLNTLLVFVFLYRLSQKKLWLAAVGSLWFGIHPLHVESVAWISERKDVLYAFFFFLSCIAYLRYVEVGTRTSLLWAFVYFILSCLSKAMATPLPFVLLLIDFYRGRKINLHTVAEKIPFLVVALMAGINALIIQSPQTISEIHNFTFMQRLLFAAGGFIFYVWKLIVPLNLSAFYPYPAVEIGKSLPLFYFLFLILAPAIIIIPLLILKRAGKQEAFKTYVFGIGFFTLMIMPVLQFITVGVAAMADRYSYVSYVGLFFMAGTFIHAALQKKQMRAAVTIATAGFSVFLVVNCYTRVSVWNNSETLWTNVINKYPFTDDYEGKNIHRIPQEGIATAYKNRANYYREKDMLDKALEDYSVVIKANPHDAGACLNLGNIYALQKQFDKVVEMYSRAIDIDSSNTDAYANRGMTYSLLQRYPEALTDLNKALSLAPNSPDIMEKMAHLQMKMQHYEETVALCSKLIESGTVSVNTLFFRGVSLAALHKTTEAIADLEQVVSIQPGRTLAWSQLMNLYYDIQQFDAARNAANQAASLGYPVDNTFLAELETRSKH